MKSTSNISTRFSKTETLDIQQTLKIKGGDDKRPIVSGGTLPPPPIRPNGIFAAL